MARSADLAQAQADTKLSAQQKIEAICRKQPLANCAISIFALKGESDTLASVGAKLKLVPASNVKVITTGLALNLLGKDFQFETRIEYSGKIEAGVLKGDLYIIGGGDPTTGAKVPCAQNLNSLFEAWRAMISKAGISSIEGKVIGDPRYFSASTSEGLGWTYDDLGTNYGAGPLGLNFFENAQHFLVKPGSAVGSTPNISQSYPVVPWMEYLNLATTGPARSANTLYYINTALSPAGEFGGSFPLDRKAYTMECSNRYGAFTLAHYFRNFLISKGIKVSGAAADVTTQGYIRTSPGARNSGQKAAANTQNLGTTLSPSLSQITRETLCESDNFFAETLLRQMSVRKGRTSSEGDCQTTVKELLSDMGLPTAGLCQVFDGSGLSRKNYISAEYFVRFLRKMSGASVWDAFLYSLPAPGERGTLEYKFPKATKEFRARIKMKSGSMNGIRCYSGYILSGDDDPSKMITFSLLINNLTASTWATNPPIDAIIEALAAEN